MPTKQPLVDSELADSQPQRRSGPWKLIVIVVLLTLIGVWLVPSETTDEDTGTAETRETTGGDQTEPADTAPSLLDQDTASVPAASLDADTTPSETEIDNRPGAKARALIAQMRASGQIDLDAVFSAAEGAQAEGEFADAYLLYFFAARDGHAQSALALGRQADPQNHDPGNSVFDTPDLNQAHTWYQVAAQNGNDDGRQQLSALRERIERQAAKGDPEAQRISLLWQ